MKHFYAYWLLGGALALAQPALAQTGAVGIGTTAPDASAALDIVSSAKGVLLPRVASAAAISNPAAGLLVYQTGSPAGFYYNAGTATTPSWQQLATATGAAVTASNGLTKTGQNLTLGGPLTQNTTLGLNGNSLELGGAPVAQQITQLTQSTVATTPAAGGWGQSFTLPAGATITRVDVYGDGGGTFRVFNGEPGGAVLAAQAVSYAPSQTLTAVVLNSPVTVATAGTYSFQTGGAGPFALNSGNPYTGGSAYTGTGILVGSDLKFVVYYTTPTGTALYASSTSGVGVATNAPTATLDVAGSTRLRGLGAGVVSADANGNLSSSSASGSFVLNQSATDQTGSFRLTGLGVAGGLLATNHPGITTQGAYLQWNRSGAQGETWLINQRGGGNNDAGIRFGKSDASDAVTEFGRFVDNGNLGLGNFGATGGTPLTRLSISPSTTEAKITLYDGGNGANHYGLGVSGGQLNYHVLTTADRHVFYAGGKNGDGTELLRVQGDGLVGIGLTAASGAPSATLDVNGSARVRGLGAGVVTSSANGTLSSSSPATAFGSNFIQNQAAADQAASFRLNGTGYVSKLGIGPGATTPGTLLDLGNSYGATPTDPATRKITLFNDAANSAFYGLGISVGRMHLFAEAGSASENPAFTLTNTDRVGINTINPTEALDVTGNANASGNVTAGGSVTGAALQVTTTVPVSTQGAHLQWNRSGSDGATWLLNQQGGGGASAGIRFGGVTTANVATEYARFTANGYFGIGTTSPAHPLTVQANSSAEGRLLGFNTASGADKYNFSYQAPAGSGNSAVPGGLNLSESNVASGRLYVQDGGRVGINTTNPTEALEVGGNVKASTYTYAAPKSYTVGLSAADFQPASASTGKLVYGYTSVGGYKEEFYVNVANGALRAPLHLPVGATITNFVVYYTDASASTNLTVTLQESLLTNFAAITPLASFTSNNTSGFFYYTMAQNVNRPVNPNCTYYLQIDFGSSGTNLSVAGIQVNYTVNQAD